LRLLSSLRDSLSIADIASPSAKALGYYRGKAELERDGRINGSVAPSLTVRVLEHLNVRHPASHETVAQRLRK